MSVLPEFSETNIHLGLFWNCSEVPLLEDFFKRLHAKPGDDLFFRYFTKLLVVLVDAQKLNSYLKFFVLMPNCVFLMNKTYI